MLTQIEKDLSTNACNRLEKWIEDTMMRCDVVDMDKMKGLAMMASCLADALVQIHMALETDELLVLSHLSACYRTKKGVIEAAKKAGEV
jgi:hypothetical protein